MGVGDLAVPSRNDRVRVGRVINISSRHLKSVRFLREVIFLDKEMDMITLSLLSILESRTEIARDVNFVIYLNPETIMRAEERIAAAFAPWEKGGCCR
jgi:hypothetical protein